MATGRLGDWASPFCWEDLAAQAEVVERAVAALRAACKTQRVRTALKVRARVRRRPHPRAITLGYVLAAVDADALRLFRTHSLATAAMPLRRRRSSWKRCDSAWPRY